MNAWWTAVTNVSQIIEGNVCWIYQIQSALNNSCCTYFAGSISPIVIIILDKRHAWVFSLFLANLRGLLLVFWWDFWISVDSGSQDTFLSNGIRLNSFGSDLNLLLAAFSPSVFFLWIKIMGQCFSSWFSPDKGTMTLRVDLYLLVKVNSWTSSGLILPLSFQSLLDLGLKLLIDCFDEMHSSVISSVKSILTL